MVAPSKLAHIVLNTQRLPEMKDWYLKVLEAEVVFDAGYAVFITFDDEHHRLALFDTTAGKSDRDGATDAEGTRPVDAPPFVLRDGWTAEDVFSALAGPDTGLSHTAYTYDTLGDLLDNYERLAGLGITPALTVNHGPTTSMYYRDPDHHMIELQIDNFPAEEATAFMRTEVFAGTQGTGWPFDAELMLKQFRSGASPEVLTKPWGK